MVILAIETSCDETAAAIVDNGTQILSNIISSSSAMHQQYGGIVPEIAAREQVRMIIPIIESCLLQAGISHKQITALAVTAGPGLIGSLLVGVETAKTLSWLWQKPIIPVNHLVGHIYTNWINQSSATSHQPAGKVRAVSQTTVDAPRFPAVCLVVSGGHTDLVLMKGHGQFRYLGGTRDDAAGEAFDKVARLLNLGYPGGPAIEQAATMGNAAAFDLPRPMIDSLDWDFSFSGLKTAVLNHARNQSLPKQFQSDMAASFQQAIVEVLVKKTIAAAQKFKAKSIIVGGGVAANRQLANNLQLTINNLQLTIKLFVPSPQLATDNAAPIATAAYFAGQPTDWRKVFADVSLSLENLASAV
ncbi:tRNA (adenosine(37)-N6)-threonylcarbamoyltransferase complex transferase subunit TsaD [Candidatus Daviesbacteria bacterium]|nr:tRNA (adenosine(37)-N6)-threonylcarbamoyltransferase complex transferase subunit TsaD [Candidatus Daviesbacteria bacterium]